MSAGRLLPRKKYVQCARNELKLQLCYVTSVVISLRPEVRSQVKEAEKKYRGYAYIITENGEAELKLSSGENFPRLISSRNTSMLLLQMFERGAYPAADYRRRTWP